MNESRRYSQHIGQGSTPQPSKIGPIQGQKPSEEELAPIGLVEEVQAPIASKKIQAFGIADNKQAHKWKRQPVMTGRGAVRVRSFHGKMSDQGLGYLDEQVNEWLDRHPEIDVKFVTSTVGVFEGKIREPALVLNIWY